MNLDSLSESDLTAHSDAAGETAWLRDHRLVAFKRYLDQDWPDSRQDEFWRSTPFATRINVERELVSVAAEVEVPTSVLSTIDAPTASVQIVDGEVTNITVPTELTDQGLILTDLRRAASEHEDLVKPALGSLTTFDRDGTGGDEDRTITVNDAAWTAGVFLYVPAELELSAPIGVHIHVSQPGAHLPRVLVVAEHHAKAMLYLEHTSVPGVDALVDEVVEVIARDSSEVHVASLQTWSNETDHLSLQKVQAHRDATVGQLSVTIGGRTVRLRPETDLVGPGASTRPLGIYFADEGQWFDLQPYVRHLAAHASSDVLFKGALQGHSRTVFRGNVYVAKDAVGTDTDENNRSLILTEGARADSTPFLEIHCADITAGHGSATGQIDARHLFYLESRGIPRDEALRLIVFGFFREVLGEVDLPGMEEAALDAIDARVAAADLSTFQVNDAALQDVVS
ncbi:MAG: Fe-S cluster assembly protein SufD [Intrasporangiaceae bacterium]|nr:Fe-S cluster assembly protein SufD [Intrasporangiaceae bacterium]